MNSVVKSRFLDKVEIDESSGCWNWEGSKSLDFRYEGKTIQASQAAWQMYKTEPLPKRIIRACKNWNCVNPDHLVSDDDFTVRFMRYVNKSENGCWEWTGGVSRLGYARINFKGKTREANRIAYQLFKGDIPSGKCVCHNCDNRLCVNPDHLWLGTHKENMDDMFAKGRYKVLSGETNGSSKLTESQVLEIRKLKAEGFRAQVIADQFNTSRTYVNQIVRRDVWKHI